MLFASTAIAALLVLPSTLWAGPVGGTVVDGAATISQAGAATNINQSTNKAIINWQGFSVGANESVNFYQPGASSVTLNRVIGNETSVINGAINANGQVFIVNSAGVLFGKGSQVNVGGLVASTQDISNKDFMAGNYTFSGTSNAAVINQGRIRAHGAGTGGGYVALLGKTVSNDGVISARLGTVAMSAGEKLTLNFEGNSLLDVTIDKGALNALVENKRAIRADGGRVIMTARAADQLLAAQVNNTGIVQARTVAALKGGSTATGRKGRRTTPKANPKTDPAPEINPAGVPMAKGNIKIYAYGGTANVAGKLDASASKGGDGGFIETSGDKVKIADTAQILTKSTYGANGSWLIDPVDFTIAASGGDMTGAYLSNYLNTQGSSTILSSQGSTAGNGDIFVNDAITWSNNNTLTLTAERNVNINQTIKAEGGNAGLVLNAGNDININNAVMLDGASATLAMTFNGNYNIRTRASYSGVANAAGPVTDKDGNPLYDENGNQIIGAVAKQDTSGGVYGSISFTNSNNKNGLVINGVNYTLIHNMSDLVGINSSTPDINGYANGNGNYAIASDMYATSDGTASGTATSYNSAVITSLSGSLAGLGHTISKLTIDAGTTDNIGLIGQITAPNTTIRDIGLIGANIAGRDNVGTLLGYYESTGLTISQAYSTGAIVGANYVGGLVGTLGTEPANRTNVTSATLSTIHDSYSDASVSGGNYVGGLIGRASGATITDTRATGNVTAVTYLGGLIGLMAFTTVDTSYATGEVKGVFTNGSVSNNIGGLIGFIEQYQRPGAKSSVSNSFATGAVSGEHTLGGLIGRASGLTTGDDVRDGFDQFWITVTNSYATGNVTLNDASNLTGDGVDRNQGVGYSGLLNLGGLIGAAANVHIAHSFATGDVVSNAITGSAAGIGGLVGRMFMRTTGTTPSSTGSITDSFATGSVRGGIRYDDNGVMFYTGNNVGGLVGDGGNTTITNSYATGNVAGETAVGGLVGSGSLIVDSHATGNVTGTFQLGGLLGSGASITRSYATGNVTGISYTLNGTFVESRLIGALAGDISGLYSGYGVADSWATGTVSGSDAVGGLIGRTTYSAVITNSWWNGGPGQSNAIGEQSPETVITGGGSLTGDQVKDAQYYANGTIDQVLADRASAADAAARQAAFQADGMRTGSTIATTGGDVSSSGGAASGTAAVMSSMQQTAKLSAVDDSLKQTEQKVKDDDERRTKERKAASARANRGNAGGSGAGYGATIRSIDVDGQRFDLEGGGASNAAPAPGNNTSAPGGAQ